MTLKPDDARASRGLAPDGGTPFDAARRHPHLVVHPLFDGPEKKVDTVSTPPMQLTPTVKAALLTMRAYLIVMALMLTYHFLDLAGLLGYHAK